MRTPNALPKQLQGRIFTRAEAQASGVSDQRLRARDIERVAHAAYRHVPTTSVPSPPGYHASSLDPSNRELLRALTLRTPNVWVSHVTAAKAYGLPLPPRLAREDQIHVTAVNHCLQGAVDPQVVLHRARRRPAELASVHGMRLSSLGRLFVELSAQLSLTDQICLGDHLVRRPRRRFEGRDEPLITREALLKAVHTQGRRRGIAQARQALDLVRVGADSPPETLLRLALIRAGLPEPELQIQLDPQDEFSPAGDAGYRHARLVIQYDGEPHFHPEQQASDQWRNAQFERDGWTVVLSNRIDLRENFVRTVERVAFLLARGSRWGSH